MKPRDRAAESWELWVKPQTKGAHWKYVATGPLSALMPLIEEYPKHDISTREVTHLPQPPAMT